MPICAIIETAFIHVPKCAGTSIEIWLKNWGDLELSQKKAFSCEEIRMKNLGIAANFHRLERHFSAVDMVKCIGQEKYTEYWSFAFVRNPYARILSFYKFVLNLKHPDTSKKQVNYALDASNFSNFVIRAAEDEEMKPLFDQGIYLNDENNNCLVKFIGRFEDLRSDFRKIQSHIKKQIEIKNLNLPDPFDTPLSHHNKSQLSEPRSYRAEYTLEAKDVVTKRSINDLENFNYDF